MRRHAKAIVATSALLLTLVLGVTLANAVAPAVTVENASDVSYTTAKVKGTVDPGDHETSYHFEAATEADFSNVSAYAGFGSLAEGAGSQPVEGELTSLAPGTTYHLRLVAENGDGQSEAVAASTFTTEVVGPPSVSIDPVTTFTGTTAHFTGTSNPNAPEAAPASAAVEAGFKVNWHFECTPECPGLLSGSTAADSSSHVVQGDASGLEPNTNYEVSLIASNADGPQSAGPQSFETAAVAPQVQTLYAGSLGVDRATLAANVNPRNSPTTYQFEWGVDGNYGNVAPATPTALGASDNVFHAVTAPLTGLTQGTTYHFRIVATNTDTFEVTEGPDHSFETLAPAGPPAPTCPNAEIREAQQAEQLPDCRAYEQVSPVKKNGGSISAWGPRAATADGNDVLFSSLVTALPGAPGGGPTGSHAVRNPLAGWFSHSVGARVPPTGGKLQGFHLVSADNSQLVTASYAALAPGAAEDAANLYRRKADGTYDLLTPVPGPVVPFATQNFIGAGASADFTQIAYEAKEIDETGESPPGSLNPYKWSNGELSLIGVLPDGSIAPGGATIGSTVEFGTVRHAISADGNRVFFQAVEPGLQSPTRGQLYVRDDHGTLDAADDTTIHVSASQRTDCADHDPCAGTLEPDPDGPFPVDFLDAEAQHGDKVLFSSCEKLTDDSTAFDDAAVATSTQSPTCRTGNAGATDLDRALGRDLYLYDLESGQLSDLTTSDPRGASVSGVVGASEDLSRIYFVARGALDPHSSAEQPGGQNLYLWDQGVTRFIATLTDERGSSGTRFFGIDPDNWGHNYQTNGKRRATRTSADGRYLLFTSHKQLTSYDNRNSLACASEPPLDVGGQSFNPEGRCLQIYLYSSTDGAVTCVSCPADGVVAHGDASLGNNGQSSFGQELPRNLADDGSHVFFESPEALVPADANGRVDVYLWREGSLRLISSGKGASDSRFADATPSGSDAFFTTKDRLVGPDVDSAADLYDARVGGGFAEPVPGPACEGDACLSPPIVPNDPTPASSGFQGQGNASPAKPRCARNKVKRKGRCVARKGKPRKHSKKNRANNDRRASR